MQTVTTVGLDIAKSVFQVHCVDVADQVIIRRQLKRRYVLAFLEDLRLSYVDCYLDAFFGGRLNASRS